MRPYLASDSPRHEWAQFVPVCQQQQGHGNNHQSGNGQ